MKIKMKETQHNMNKIITERERRREGGREGGRERTVNSEQ